MQQFIDELIESLASHPDELVERRMRYLMALLHAAVESADELDALLSCTMHAPPAIDGTTAR